MNLNLFVSKTCFTYCKGCYSYSRQEKCNSILSSKQIISFLQYAYQRGISKVTLCGGDPLARVDIIELLKRIKSIGYIISLDTVGTPLIREVKVGNNTIIKKINVKDIIEFVDFWGIPIDGSTSDIIRIFRPARFDILNEQLLICKLLNKYKAKICINTVVHKKNIGDAKDLANLVKSIDGIYKWQMFEFAPLGKYGFLNRNKFEVTENDFDTFKKMY